VEKTNQELGGSFDTGGAHSVLLCGGLSEIKRLSYDFVVRRRWEHLDTQLNLCLALSSEVGEVADVVAWKGDEMNQEEFGTLRNKLAQELADVVILLLRFADKSGTDLCGAHELLERHGFVLRGGTN